MKSKKFGPKGWGIVSQIAPGSATAKANQPDQVLDSWGTKEFRFYGLHPIWFLNPFPIMITVRIKWKFSLLWNTKNIKKMYTQIYIKMYTYKTCTYLQLKKHKCLGKHETLLINQADNFSTHLNCETAFLPLVHRYTAINYITQSFCMVPCLWSHESAFVFGQKKTTFALR